MSKKLIAGAGVVASLAVALAPLATYAAENSYTSDEHTDKFEITVKDTCAFGHLAVNSGSALTGITHNTNPANTAAATPEAQAYWTAGAPETNDPESTGYDGTPNPVTPGEGTTNTGRTPDRDTGYYNVETDTAAYSIEAGTEKEGFATTTLVVYCNNSTDAKYTLKVQMKDLEKSAGVVIPAAADYSASKSGYAIDSVVLGTARDGSAVNTTNFPASTKKAYTGETIMATGTKGTATTGDAYTVTYGIGVASSQEAGTYEGTVVYTLYQGVAD